MKHIQRLNRSLLVIALFGVMLSAPQAWTSDSASWVAKPKQSAAIGEIADSLEKNGFSADDIKVISEFAKANNITTYGKLQNYKRALYCLLMIDGAQKNPMDCVKAKAEGVEKITTRTQLKKSVFEAIAKELVSDDDLYRDNSSSEETPTPAAAPAAPVSPSAGGAAR